MSVHIQEMRVRERLAVGERNCFVTECLTYVLIQFYETNCPQSKAVHTPNPICQSLGHVTALTNSHQSVFSSVPPSPMLCQRNCETTPAFWLLIRSSPVDSQRMQYTVEQNVSEC